jgi:hypothetical protein
VCVLGAIGLQKLVVMLRIFRFGAHQLLGFDPALTALTTAKQPFKMSVKWRAQEPQSRLHLLMIYVRSLQERSGLLNCTFAQPGSL